MDLSKDIFNIIKKQSLLRWALSNECLILRDTNLPRVTVPPRYSTRVLLPRRSKSPIERKITDMIDPLARKFSHINGDYLGLNAALYEAMLNAYQHGNREDDSKEIILSSEITDKKAEFFVSDNGGELDPVLGLFVLNKRLRKGNIAKGFYEFARDFSTRKPKGDNKGRGTHILHSYFDSVHYYRSENDGLIIHMKRKHHPK